MLSICRGGGQKASGNNLFQYSRVAYALRFIADYNVGNVTFKLAATDARVYARGRLNSL